MSDTCTELRSDCDERFNALEKWQERQNGSLQRLDAKMDKVLFGVVTACLACIGTLVVLLVR